MNLFRSWTLYSAKPSSSIKYGVNSKHTVHCVQGGGAGGDHTVNNQKDPE